MNVVIRRQHSNDCLMLRALSLPVGVPGTRAGDDVHLAGRGITRGTGAIGTYATGARAAWPAAGHGALFGTGTGTRVLPGGWQCGRALLGLPELCPAVFPFGDVTIAGLHERDQDGQRGQPEAAG